MAIVHPIPEIEQMRSLLDGLSKRLAGLPADQQAQVREELDSIRSGVCDLMQSLGGPACAEGMTSVESSLEAINERRQAEEALQHAHEDLINERNRLRAVMESLPIGLAIYDEKGGVLTANPAFEAVWGSPRPPANSVDDYDSYKAWWVETGERVKPEEWAAARAVNNGETVAGQYIQLQRFDGTLGTVMNSGAPIRDAQGRVIGAAVAIMDVTERIRIEKALEESRDRFRVALTSVPLLVYTCDSEQRYTWVSNSGAGNQVQNLLGKRDDEIFPAQAVSELIAAKQQALETGQGGVREVRVRLPDQTRYYVLTTEPIIDVQGVVCGLTCSAIDISEQKQLEIEQEAAEMKVEVQRRLMEFREQERQEMARDLHDGPIQMLTATIFHMQAARDDLPDPRLQLVLDQISQSLKEVVSELRNTMNELRPPAIIHFGLAKSARIHARDFQERHPELKLSLSLFNDGTLLPESTRLALYRIFQEGLNNIVKHANANQVWVRLSKKGNEVQLQVRDNGAGFEVPTDMVLQTRRGHYGLASMKERAEAIGGRFSVISEPGKGTTMLVCVPVHDSTIK